MRTATTLLCLLAFPGDPGRDSELTARSPDGKYLFEVKVGEGEKGGRPRYIYALSEAAGRKVLWEKKQGDQERSPSAAWVSDQGQVVLSTAGQELHVFDREGKMHYTLDLIKGALTPEEEKRYVRRFDHGVGWSELSHWYLTALEGRPCFCIRTWWDHRIIVDLQDGALKPEDDKIRASLDLEEKRFVMDALKRCVEGAKQLGRNPSHEEIHEKRGHGSTPAYLAGKLKLMEALPLLMEMEAWDLDHDWDFTVSGADEPVAEGEVNPFKWRTNRLRQIVAHSIRRLGAVPRSLPSTRFVLQGKPEAKFEYFRPKENRLPRADRVEPLKKGMNLREVLDTLAEPDFFKIHQNRSETQLLLEYDVDAKVPYTLCVTLTGLKVDLIDRVVPPLWQQEGRREREYIR